MTLRRLYILVGYFIVINYVIMVSILSRQHFTEGRQASTAGTSGLIARRISFP